MSAFEDFIQIELPKRPYLNGDVPQNSIIIRSGIGPKQLGSISLAQGQTLTVDSNGDLVSVNPSSLIKKFILTVGTPTTLWVLTHNLSSENVIVQCFDESKNVIFPETVQIIDANEIRVTFSVAQQGVARVIFLD